MENVNEFRYLAALINNYGRDQKKIESRIGMAKNAFKNLNSVLKNKTLSFRLQKRISDAIYVWIVLKCICETCTMNADGEKRLLKHVKIPSSNFLSNTIVLARIKEKNKTIVDDIRH